MGGPEMAPHTPQRSERPGGAVALLYGRRRLGAPAEPWRSSMAGGVWAPRRSRGAPLWPAAFGRAGGAVALVYGRRRLGAPAEPWRSSMAGGVWAPGRSRGAPLCPAASGDSAELWRSSTTSSGAARLGVRRKDAGDRVGWVHLGEPASELARSAADGDERDVRVGHEATRFVPHRDFGRPVTRIVGDREDGVAAAGDGQDGAERYRATQGHAEVRGHARLAA